jgi:hypothetical protein
MATSRPFYLAYEEAVRRRDAEEERKKREKELEEQRLLALKPPSVDPIEESLFEQFRESDRMVKKALDPSPQRIPTSRLTLTQLKNDNEFADTAERFMDTIGRNENIFEYLRDANFSLSAAAQRSFEMGDWDEQTMQDYNYLRTRFNNAEIGSFKERLGQIKDIGGDILFDPVNWLTLLFAAPTGGGALGARATVAAAQAKGTARLAQQGLKRYTKAKFEKDVGRESAKRFGLLGASEGLAWAGLHDYFMQDIDVNLGLQDEIDVNRLAVSSTLGATLGGAVGAGIGRLSVGPRYAKMLEKEYKFASEANVDATVPKYRQGSLFDEDELPTTKPKEGEVKPTPKPKKEEEPTIRQQEEEEYRQQQQADSLFYNDWMDKDKIPNPIKWFSRTFVEKPTKVFYDRLQKLGPNASFTLMNNLRKLRPDVDRDALGKKGTGVKQIQLNRAYADDLDRSTFNKFTNEGYGEYFASLIGNFNTGLEQAFGVLGLTGVFRTRIATTNNNQVRDLLQNKDLMVVRERAIDKEGNYYGFTGKETIMQRTMNEDGTYTFNKKINVGDEVDGIKLDAELHFGYRRLRGLYDEVYDLSIQEGLIDSSVSKLGYFPRMFNHSAVQKKREILQEKIIKYGHANPDNTKMKLTDYIDETGNPIEVAYFKGDKGLDWNTFTILREGGYDSFEDIAASVYYRSLTNKQKQSFNNRADVKQFVKDNELRKGQSYKFLIDKIDEKSNLTIDFSKLKNFKRNDTVSAYEYARQVKAETIVTDMLEKRHIPNELKMLGKRYGENAGFLQSRRFVNIPDRELNEFLEDDVMTISNQYFNNASQILARSRYFGKNISEQEDKIFKPMREELQEAGLSLEEAAKITDDFRKVVRKVTGLDNSHLDSWWNKTAAGRNLGDFLKLSQQMAHLPLATLSSITEPLILLTRDFSSDTTKDIGRALLSETSNMFDRIGKTVSRARGKATPRQKLSRLGVEKRDGEFFNVGRFTDDEWFELYQTGLALEQTVMERIEGLAGEALNGRVFKGFQNAFFKSNLLTQWTKAVQLASFTTGKRIVRQHAQALATNKTSLGGTLSAGRRQQFIDELNEFGIREKDAIRWYKNSVTPDGKINENFAKGLNNRGEMSLNEEAIFNAKFHRQMIKGANRFTKEIILNPSVAEANRPLWFSNPSAQFLMQFAGYPTVFTNTVLKRFAREVSKDGSRKEMYRTGRILPTVMLMTAIAHIGNELRSNGKATLEYGTNEKKPDHKIILDAVRRWGGLGPFDYAQRFANERERGTGFVAETLKSISGPIPQDIIDAILYRKGLAELTVTNMPYFQLYDAIFGEGTKKKLKGLARGSTGDRKKKVPDVLARLGYDRGGIVMNVPNVPDEPDERVDKLTGESYNNTSENAQDLSDRELKRQQFFFGGRARRQQRRQLRRQKTQEFVRSSDKSILAGARDAIGRRVYPMYKKGAKYFGFDKAEQDKAFEDSYTYIDEFIDKGALTNLKSRSDTRLHSAKVSDDVTEIVRHALLGYRIGDTLPKRISLQAKDATQAAMYYGYTEDKDFGSGPKSGYSFRNERGDLINNRIGFGLRKKYGDDERAAMEELMLMIARGDEALHYVNKTNLVEKTFNPYGRRVM